MRRTVIVMAALAMVVAGCGGGEELPTKSPHSLAPVQTASSPSPRPGVTKDSAGCRVLTAKERRSIAGEKLDIVVPIPVIKGMLLCKWVESLADPKTISIRVISQPVSRWVKGLPKQIDRTIALGRASDKMVKRLKAAEKRIIIGHDEIGNAEACRMFSLLVQANSKKKGITEGILYQGTVSGGYTVTWQKCAGGVHTEFVYEEPNLQVSLALGQSVIRLGKIAHRRSVQFLASE